MNEIETIERWEKIKDLAWEHDLKVETDSYDNQFVLYFGISEQEKRIRFAAGEDLLNYLIGYHCAMERKSKVEND